jgi:O-methyltransferase
MLNEKHVRQVTGCLQWTIYKQVPGDVVELGCNSGNMAIYLQSILAAISPEKTLHVYDSFQGLPDPSSQDMSPLRRDKKGDMAVSANDLIKFFLLNNVPLPAIHQGWFRDQQYPDRISFAFFDSDFYQSILDSWEKVYPRLSPGAIVTVHDYGFAPLVGVHKACEEFLADKRHLHFWDDYVGIELF